MKKVLGIVIAVLVSVIAWLLLGKPAALVVTFFAFVYIMARIIGWILTAFNELADRHIN